MGNTFDGSGGGRPATAEIGLKEVYDVALETKQNVSSLATTTAIQSAGFANVDADHEKRLRALEANSWRLTAALIVAALLLGTRLAEVAGWISL